jgi:uncharacterized membrane protein
MPHAPDPTELPPVRQVAMTRPLAWLRLGWQDLWRCGPLSLLHGVAMTGFGALIAWLAHDQFWWLAGAFSGFMVVAPVLATSLYALSRAIERGEPANLALVQRTWLNWQRSHRNKWGNDYWCLVQFGSLLAASATGWVLTSAALITLLAPVPVLSPLDFLRHVVLADSGWLFEFWLVLGGIMAAPIFASSVVAIPLLLDRRFSLRQAVLTSWRCVTENPVCMAAWAALIMLLVLLGLGTLLLGLILVMPVLGHASWHAYRELVDVSGLPARDAEPGAQGSR